MTGNPGMFTKQEVRELLAEMQARNDDTRRTHRTTAEFTIRELRLIRAHQGSINPARIEAMIAVQEQLLHQLDQTDLKNLQTILDEQ